MVIQIHNLVSGANTADQGNIVNARLRAALKSGDKIVLSFAGVQTATSSFVNAAFVRLLNDWKFDELKGRLRIVDSTRQINQMIKTRLEKSSLVDA